MPSTDEDVNLLRGWKAPELAMPIDPEEGPVLVTVEYQIDPQRAAEFEALMSESRRVWLKHGLLAWLGRLIPPLTFAWRLKRWQAKRAKGYSI